MTNPETQLASYFAKYDPAIVKLGKALRAKLRARLPGLFELVYVYDSSPQRIVYALSAEGGLCASIGFAKGGRPRRFEFTREGS